MIKNSLRVEICQILSQQIIHKTTLTEDRILPPLPLSILLPLRPKVKNHHQPRLAEETTRRKCIVALARRDRPLSGGRTFSRNNRAELSAPWHTQPGHLVASQLTSSPRHGLVTSSTWPTQTKPRIKNNKKIEKRTKKLF